jgi:hypothetical protein
MVAPLFCVMIFHPSIIRRLRCHALLGLLLIAIASGASGQEDYVAPAPADAKAPFQWAVGVDAMQLLSGMAVLTAERAVLPELSVRTEVGVWTGDVLGSNMLPTLGDWTTAEIVGGQHMALGVRMYPAVESPRAARLTIGFEAAQGTYHFALGSHEPTGRWVHREVRAVLGVLKPIGAHFALSGHVAFSGDWNASSMVAVRPSGVNADFRNFTRWGGLGVVWMWGSRPGSSL